MTCHICETIERDLKDVVRALQMRTAAQVSAPPTNLAALDLEIRALTSSKTEIEAKYWKHRKSISH